MTTEIPEEIKKAKETIEKVGLKIIVVFTFSYFFMLFLMPVLILSLFASIFQISIQTQLFSVVAAIVFIGYFALDLIQITRNKFTFTLASIIVVLLAVIIVIKVFYSGISLLTVDENTPRNFKGRVFPLNVM